MNSRGERKEETRLIYCCQEPLLCEAENLVSPPPPPPPDFLFILVSSLRDFVINLFLRSKVGLQLKKHKRFSTLEPGPHRKTLGMEITVGDSKDGYIYLFDM